MHSFLRRAAALCTFTLAGSAIAAEPIDLPGLMRQAGGATEATVILVPPMSLYRDSLNETKLQQEGCRFVTSDAAALRSLVALLRDANINTSPVYQKPDIREGVYLTMADNTRLAFFFQDNNGARLPVTGVVETSVAGMLRSEAITARSTLATDLRSWATSRGGSGDGAACNRKPLPTEAPTPLPPPQPVPKR